QLGQPAYPPGPVLVPQVAPMLAQLQSQLPIGDGWRYEPKLDGFRGMLQRHSRPMRLLSRNGRDLGPWFPELIQAGRHYRPTRSSTARLSSPTSADMSTSVRSKRG